jgi:hypothetical protein
MDAEDIKIYQYPAFIYSSMRANFEREATATQLPRTMQSEYSQRLLIRSVTRWAEAAATVRSEMRASKVGDLLTNLTPARLAVPVRNGATRALLVEESIADTIAVKFGIRGVGKSQATRQVKRCDTSIIDWQSIILVSPSFPRQFPSTTPFWSPTLETSDDIVWHKHDDIMHDNSKLRHARGMLSLLSSEPLAIAVLIKLCSWPCLYACMKVSNWSDNDLSRSEALCRTLSYLHYLLYYT